MDKLKKLQKHFQNRSINKSEFANKVREKYPTFSRQKLNTILKGKIQLTNELWEQINSVLKWQ